MTHDDLRAALLRLPIAKVHYLEVEEHRLRSARINLLM
jgi:hypothetical protein